MPRYTEQELADAQLVWVLSITVAGAVYRLAREVWRFEGLAGEVVTDARLDLVECGVEVSPDSKQVPEQSARVEFRLQPAAWRALVAPGRSCTAELRLIRVGDAWERGEVVLDGSLDAERWGAPSEPVQAQVRESLAQGAGALLGPNAVASEATYPGSGTLAVDEQHQGAGYPFVFGAPGRPLGDEDSEVVPAVPALLVRMSFGSPSDNSSQDATVLVAGHAMQLAPGGADSVRVFNMSRHEPNSPQKFWEDFPAVLARDEEGRRVSHVVLPAPGLGATSLYVEGGAETYASFLEGAGGLTVGGRLVRGAGDLLAWLLGQCGMRVAPLANGVREALNTYQIDGYYNTSPLVRDIIQRDILPLVPASLVPGPEGWELVWWNLRATRADAVRVIDVQQEGLERAGEVTRASRSSVRNRVAIEYAPRADTGQFTRRLEYGPERRPAGAASTRRYERHRVASLSAERIGEERAGRVLRSSMVWDPTTAGRILADDLLLGALRPVRLTYEGPQWLQAYRPGQVVVLRDSELELDLPCWVLGTSRGPGRCRIALRELPSHLLG